jgi:oxygen-independent coproporphyrinogen-3 oxidase
MTGLYVHIPFCKKKCHYCNFVVALAGTDASHRVYLNALEKEAAHTAGRFADTAFDTVYLGGGTPSTLRTGEFEWLFHILKGHFHWKKDAEITCEVNPGDIPGLERAFFLKRLGIDRVSLGAQSFHDETLKRLNRDHGTAEIESAFRYLRDAGFKNISLDLILSLPGESWSAARESLERAARLSPEHISLYELTIEDKTVFARMRREGTLELPSEEEQFETLSNARLFLQEAGYRHYELLSYARPGFESRHNLLYWANEDYLGLGPGAYSYFDGRRFRNSGSYEEYLKKVLAGDWTALEEETLDVRKKELESLLLALRLTDGADAAKFSSVISERRGEIAGLREKGLLLEEQGRLRLSARGQFFAETVFTELSS